MKHLTFSDKSLLIDDETADTLVEYAALLVNHDKADSVDVHAFGADGDEVEATLLLSAGAPIMVESTHTSLNEPANEKALEHMRREIRRLTAANRAQPDDGPDTSYTEHFES
ncbi:hypothetical protein [Leifsonia sp. ALI-44-B]|uniref:hypothetical protein n=1 Tax=Leifsonia sp. ALI-44-B TaxID=1933776 RepID=UPI00097C8D6B|nr:hypothetical protein [Leifsonia sp. ALI-44-B]